MTVKKRFVSVIVKVIAILPSKITQFADHVRISLISQLIKGISRVSKNYWSI